MPADTAERRRIFRALHESGCFVIPNPWDAGSARYLQHLGFKALATTSSGCAWSMGLPDNAVGLEAMLAHLGAIVAATALPVNADFENGYADEPSGVAANVARAVETGVAGLSIEDSTGRSDHPLYDLPQAVERIKAARQAIDRSNSGVLLTARAECFLVGHPDPLNESLRRLQAYAAAGADCLYAPGVKTPEQIAAVVKAVAPKPVNVLTVVSDMPVATFAGLGVRRISVGGALARAAWGEFMRVAKEIAEEGRFTGFARAAPFAEINGFFAGEAKKRS
ncbi:MAG TPA: isocitrate lyase/phosphoenolpyruvate mutase family protein [Candidatus Udaeobacter sp.]|nr:isocitrate lyase/phosphoenolpyruvate mutase family protein [Candidatus Udaeobacter sp.]